jgi:hypothetical protein
MSILKLGHIHGDGETVAHLAHPPRRRRRRRRKSGTILPQHGSLQLLAVYICASSSRPPHEEGDE